MMRWRQVFFHHQFQPFCNDIERRYNAEIGPCTINAPF